MKKIYIILTITFLLIFLGFYYKNLKLGNTIIKLNEEEIIENILNGKLKYEAKIKVKVYSNKNENEYQLSVLENGETNRLEVIGEDNISGLIIEKKDKDLIVKNAKLKLEKLYENYKEITDNSLLLNSFSKDYEDIKETEEKDGITLKITIKNTSKYIKYKELYLDKETGIPVKMVIKDSSNKPKIIIEYTSIKML